MPYKIAFVSPKIHYGNLRKEILGAIDDVLSRGDLILRKDVDEFEQNFASLIGVKYAVALNSGTDALFLALKANGIGPGDQVITVSHTFVATISSIVQCGAVPLLVDVKDDFTMDIEKVEKVITSSTKAIIPVHLNGRMCDMQALMKIANKHNLVVIEDAAQAIGAKFNKQMAGSFGQAGAFSFYPFKILGCFGDGGAIATNDSKMQEKTRLLRDHGQKTKTELVCYGWNSRLDNMQAAILNIKLKYLSSWIERRREIARIYQEKLSGIPEIKLPPFPDSDSRYFDVFQNYVLRAKNRDGLSMFLKENGVETLIKDPIPTHAQEGLSLSHFHLPFTEQLAREVISLPLYPELEDEEAEYVAQWVINFYNIA